MKTKFTWLGIVAILILGISTFFVGCNKDDLNAIVNYHGQVVYINTTTPFPDLTVKVTNGKETHCQTQTDAGGLFSLKVRVSEIDGSYYLLAGDSTCIPKKINLGGYGQAEVDLGVIEVEGPALPTVKTTPLTEVTAEGASLGGEVLTDGRLAVTARGICYGTTQQPAIEGMHTTDGGGLGTFTTTLKNLEHNTIYYARAYATNKMGTAYGEQVKFTTELGVPIVVSDSVYRIMAHTAKCKGHVESDGGYAVTKKGTCWSKQPDPTVDDECTNDGSGKGEFTSTLSNLLENTTYYVRTYATNATATVYGEQIIITTLDGLAVVQTDSVSDIKATGFSAYGTVVSDCGIPVTQRGFCYAQTQFPTIENEIVVCGNGLGKFDGNIQNLQMGKTYYVRAYATNSTKTTYGEQISITTNDGLPTLTTKDIKENNISQNAIITGGTVTADGGYIVTARGVCWSLHHNPTTNDFKTIDGSGMGSFVSTIKEFDFVNNTNTYYIRAYATNEAGTAYGNEVAVTYELYDYATLPKFVYKGDTYVFYHDIGAMSFGDAMQACKTLVVAGYNDWELPIGSCMVSFMQKCYTGWMDEYGNPLVVYRGEEWACDIQTGAMYWTTETNLDVNCDNCAVIAPYYRPYSSSEYICPNTQLNGYKHSIEDNFLPINGIRRVRPVRKYIVQ